MRTSIEMLSVSPDGTIKPFPNILRIYAEGRMVYVEVEAVHDGHKVTSTVVVERAVFRYHVVGSGVLS
jgi:hypothetical protein